jgi:hypothetical protein
MALSPEKLAEIRAKAQAALSKTSPANSTVTVSAPVLGNPAISLETSVSGTDLVVKSGSNLSVSSSRSAPAPLGNAAQIQSKIAELQLALQQSLPSYESLLHQIHKALAADEDVVHILTEEEIGTIVAGLSKKKALVIVDSQSKSKSNSKKLASLTTDDL